MSDTISVDTSSAVLNDASIGAFAISGGREGTGSGGLGGGYEG